jgi:protein-S-isoprenylcysteine O-methyltransferase Ste14
MESLIVFGVLSIPIVLVSWRTLFNFRSHGFYRFFSWECIIWLVASDYSVWFKDPLSLYQIFSWIFLLISAYLVISGVILLRTAGKPVKNRDDKALYSFEKTSELIDLGIFRYIRHPLYASLIFLTWGIFLKNTTFSLLPIALLSTGLLYITAKLDEKECVQYFGVQYIEYMKRSKRFIPFLI